MFASIKKYILRFILLIGPLVLSAHNPLSAKFYLKVDQEASILTINLSQGGVHALMKKLYGDKVNEMGADEYKKALVQYVKSHCHISFAGQQINLKQGGIKLGSHQTDLKFLVDMPTAVDGSLKAHIPAFSENGNHQTIFVYDFHGTKNKIILSNKNGYKGEVVIGEPSVADFTFYALLALGLAALACLWLLFAKIEERKSDRRKNVPLKITTLILFATTMACQNNNDDSSELTDDGLEETSNSSNDRVEFSLGDSSYAIILNNLDWETAAVYASELDGYLAEINSQEEQDAIFNELMGLTEHFDGTLAPDGGGYTHFWIGANDLNQEGVWIWDGNNDKENTVQFWEGTQEGTVLGDLFNNWGYEPSNGAGGQNAAGIVPVDWTNGDAGTWNDVRETNELYFIVEWD